VQTKTPSSVFVVGSESLLALHALSIPTSMAQDLNIKKNWH
jgi:hypothetical protein